MNIVTYTEILIKQLTEEVDLELNIQKQLQFLERIGSSCLALKTVTTLSIELSLINPKPILEECVKILAKEALRKSVVLKSAMQQLLPLMSDELRFKQIILGMLSRSIKLSPQGKVSMIASSVTQDKKAFLKVVIQDDGIGLAEEEWSQMASLYKQEVNSKYSNGTDLDLNTVKKLIHKLQGQLDIKSVWQKGNTVSLLFPYLTEKEWDEYLNSSPEEGSSYLD